jgi:signal transduction histidine kinase
MSSYLEDTHKSIKSFNPDATIRRRAVYASTRRGRLIAVVVILLALSLLTAIVQRLIESRTAPVVWKLTSGSEQRLVIARSAEPALARATDKPVSGFSTPGSTVVTITPALTVQAPRWIFTVEQRERYFAQHAALSQVMSGERLRIHFSDGSTLDAPLEPRGLGGIGVLFWLSALIGLALVTIAAVNMSTQPTVTNGLFVLASVCIAGGLWLVALDASRGLTWPAGMPRAAFVLSQWADLIGAAAMFAAAARYPVLTWMGRNWPLPLALAAAVGVVTLWTQLNTGWALAWIATLAYCVGVAALMIWAQRTQPNPAAYVLSRWALAVLAGAVVMAAVIWALPTVLPLRQQYSLDAELFWRTLMVALLCGIPFLSRTQYLFRQLLLLLLVSAVVVALDVAFISFFSFNQQTSLIVALLVSFWLYLPVRQFVLSRWLVQGRLSSSQLFERLYAVTRAAEQGNERATQLWTALLTDVFQPLDAFASLEPVDDAELRSDGELLIVALPLEQGSVVLRYAESGRRLFSPADASLARSALAQVRGALQVQRAVEKGRAEERERIARDLHDDIGARLLTLMYRVPNREMQDYARRTIQDLKTLVRGLALPGSKLEDSAAEWKSEITQRLAAASIQLEWRQQLLANPSLSAEQWSALTRVMRELASNVIQHAQAQNVFIEVAYVPDELRITFTDDGRGAKPEIWSHGLGLGGIRKRIGKLGGSVQWSEHLPSGITCDISMPVATQTVPIDAL